MDKVQELSVEFLRSLSQSDFFETDRVSLTRMHTNILSDIYFELESNKHNTWGMTAIEQKEIADYESFMLSLIPADPEHMSEMKVEEDMYDMIVNMSAYILEKNSGEYRVLERLLMEKTRQIFPGRKDGLEALIGIFTFMFVAIHDDWFPR